MQVLVINSGSSSLKFQLFDWPRPQPLLRGLVDRIGEAQSRSTLQVFTGQGFTSQPERLQRVATHLEALEWVADQLSQHAGSARLAVIGHRVVHGGERYFEPCLITPEVRQGIRELIPLAPLHNPANLVGIEACVERFPATPQVAVFDTGFHHTLPECAYRYALPEDLSQRYQIRRYGFHGTSHSYVSRCAAQYLQKDPNEVNLVVLHLGNGASACAVRAGKSVDTSLGFTPLEGLVMGTRCGDIDPAIHFFLAREAGMSLDQIEQVLTKQSGLKGLCGANDMRDIELRAQQGDLSAQRALELFCYRVRKYVGAYFAVLGKVDALVFTAGIGEHSATVRSLVCTNLSGLGVELNAHRNQGADGTLAELQSAASRVAILLVPTNEEYEIARCSTGLLEGASNSLAQS